MLEPEQLAIETNAWMDYKIKRTGVLLVPFRE